LKIGDDIRLKKDYNVSVCFGNVGFVFAGGSKGIILQTEEGTTVASIGFYLNETVTVTALVDQDSFEVVK
jgi:hypothetical protein